LQAKKILGELLSPKTANRAQALIKEHHPDYATDRDKASPFIDEGVQAAKKVLEDHIKAEKDKDLDRKFNADLDHYRLSAANPNGFTDEGIDKLKGMMRDRQIYDVHAAVLAWNAQNPAKPDIPSGYKPTDWNFGEPIDKDDEDKKLLFRDPDAWADRDARKFWEELNSGKISV
jgi:hypothetical protein